MYDFAEKFKTTGNTTNGGLWLPSTYTPAAGTNTAGMYIDPAGIINNNGGPGGRNSDANFWCSDQVSSTIGMYYNFNHDARTMYRDPSVYNKHFGFSI